MTQNMGVCRLSQVLCRHQLHHSAYQTSLFRGQSIDPTNTVSVRLSLQAVVMTKLTVKSRLRNSRWPAPRICCCNPCWRDINQPFGLTASAAKSRRSSNWLRSSKCAITMESCLVATWLFFWIRSWPIAVNLRLRPTWTPPSSIPFHPKLRSTYVHGQTRSRDEKYISTGPFRSPGMEERSLKPSTPMPCLYSLSTSISISDGWSRTL